jgi:hypothetical protein
MMLRLSEIKGDQGVDIVDDYNDEESCAKLETSGEL